MLCSLLAVSLSGCLIPDEIDGADADRFGAAPALNTTRTDGLVTAESKLLRWGNVSLTAGDHSDQRLCLASCMQMDCTGPDCVPADCPDASCAEYPFTLGYPPLITSIALRFPTDRTLAMRAWLVDAEGQGIAELVDSGYSFAVAKAASVHGLDAGTYAVRVYQTAGEGTHELVVRDEGVPQFKQDGLLLPDLVTLPPTDLTFQRPPEHIGVFGIPSNPVHALLADTAANEGCTIEEHTNDAPQKCLRFSNAVGNIGNGPLRLVLSLPDAATFPTSGRWTQLVQSADGWQEHRSGPTEFHVAHAHWHDAVSNRYTVHAVDVESGERGDELDVGRKTGVCFGDIGLVDLDVPRISVPTENGVQCFVPDGNGYATGLSPGWYDNYPWILADQFVDMGDAPDGVYDLCSTSNAEGMLLESNLTNNASCTRFQMTGFDIEVLDERPYHADTDNGWY